MGAIGGALLAGFALTVKGKGVPAEYVPVLGPENLKSTTTSFDESVQVLWSQILCTFIFVSVILILKGKKTAVTDDTIIVAGAVGLTLWALICLNTHTGACFNPAIAASQTFF